MSIIVIRSKTKPFLKKQQLFENRITIVIFKTA